MAQFDEEKQKQIVSELRKEEAENLTQILSKRHGLPYIDLTVTPINIGALRVVSEKEARAAKLAPFNIVDKKISLGILSPSNLKSLEVVENLKRKGFEPSIFMVTQESLENVWKRYKDLSEMAQTHRGSLDIQNEEILEFIKQTSTLKDIKLLIEDSLASNKPYRISKILEIMLAGSLSTKASDIHLEPEEDYVRLRYRLDGVLNDILNFETKTYNLLLSRIKLLSNLKINTEGLAQDAKTMKGTISSSNLIAPKLF